MMKLIRFSLMKLINNIRNNIILFLVFFLGMFLSAIALIYFYGNMTYYMKNKDSAELQYRKYSVLRTRDYGWVKENNGTLNSSFGLPNNMVSLERVQSVFREDSRVENIFLYSILCESETNEIFITNSNTQFISSLVIEDNYKVYIKERKGRIEFTESEKAGENVVIIPATCYLSIGEYIDIYGKDYKIIGQHTLDDVFYIPFNTMIKEQLPTLKLQLIVNKRIIDAKEDAEFCEYLYDKFLTEPVFDKNGEVLNVGIGSPYFYLETDFEESFSEVLFLCVLYIFSSIIFMILFKFFWDMQRYDNMVLMLIGATKGDISFVCLIQMITLSLIPSLLAVLVHACLQTNFFPKVNWQDNLWYQRKDYLFLLAIMMLLTLIISIPLVIRYNKKRLGEILSDEKNIGFL